MGRVMRAPQRKKRGRPPFKWHGPRGEEFVRAVHLDWWEKRRKSFAHAIKVVVRDRHDFPDLEKHSDQYLRKQYLKAKAFWMRSRVSIREVLKQKPADELVEQNSHLVEQNLEPQLFP